MKFEDTSGHEWNFKINIGKALEVQELMDINLFEPSYKKDEETPTLIISLLTDDLLFSKMLSILCYEDIIKTFPEETSLADFYACLDGDTLTNAEEAFLKEYDNFFTGRHRDAQKLYVQETVLLIKKFRTSQAQEFGKSLASVESATQEAIDSVSSSLTKEE